MSWLTTLGQLVLGDWRERTRRYSFLWILVGTTFFGYLVITGKYTLVFVGYQPQINSAWVGSLMASFCAIMIMMAGFFLIRKAVERDRRTGVGQILASTRIHGFTYLLAKFVSNYMILVSCTLVLVGAAVVMQLLGDKSGAYSLVDLLTPFVVTTLPVLGLVAGMAVLFESVRWLRGTLGNIVYFFVFEAVLLVSVVSEPATIDLAGFYQYTTSMKASILALYPEAKIATQMGLVGVFEGMSGDNWLPFTWPGIEWTLAMFLPRLAYPAVGVAITGLAALAFDRFDPACTRQLKPKKKKTKSADPANQPGESTVSSLSIRQVSAVEVNFNPLPLILAELRLMLKGYHWSWYLVAVSLIGAQIAAPIVIVRQFILPAALIWPLAVWSAMGTREKRFDTELLLYSSPSSLTRQFPASWAAGLAVTLAMISGTVIHTLLAGDPGRATSLLVGALFIPTLALTLGSITGTRKFFEVVYLLLWYLGSVNRVWALDFAGVTAGAADHGMAYIFLGITAILLPIGSLIRARRLANL